MIGLTIGTFVFALICIPIIFAIAIAMIKGEKAHSVAVYIAAAVMICLSLATVAFWLTGGAQAASYELPFAEIFDEATLIGDVVIMAIIIWQSVKHKKYAIGLLSIVQTAIILYVEIAGPETTGFEALRFDYLTMIMVLIIGIIGTLIGIYAVGYMKGYHEHHSEVKDRRRFFMAIVFLFYGAMVGLVTTQNVLWMEFFWETTSLCSFLLIGYTKSDEAIRNSFRALWMNLVGGLGFVVVIILGAYIFRTQNLYAIIYNGYAMNSALWNVALCSLVFAALTKTAQFPFSKWLLGAMVAPTPSSALLHSATMVKAGVYLILRISPLLAFSTPAGYMTVFVGGFTFFVTSLLAITVSDAKKVLAYSTISNLGLMIACAGVGSSATIWAAIFLMMFHAVSKSMCFQAVGAIENTTHSRDIEDMDGMMSRYPALGGVLLIGMTGMFLAPFGMLVSKWAALKSVLDSHSLVLLFFIVFGSATTMFYWSKWMNKLIGHREQKNEDKTKKDEYLSMFVHSVIAIVLCFSLPFVSNHVLMPYLLTMLSPLGVDVSSGIASGNYPLVIIMVAAICIIPVVSFFLSRNMRGRKVPAYMNGVSIPGNVSFYNSKGEEEELHVANWYMENEFGESKLFRISAVIALAVIIVMFAIAGGAAL